jgi:outer membrane protein
MKKPFLRSLLAAVLAGILAGAPVSPAFAQEPASNPAPQVPAKDAVPISLGVSKHNYNHSPKPFPNLLAPYYSQTVDPAMLTNSPRLEQLIREGKLSLSMQDAIALALENSMDIVVQRYNPWLADVGLLKAKAGGVGDCPVGCVFGGSTANVPNLLYDPTLTQVIGYDTRITPINNPFISGTGTGTGGGVTTAGLASHSAFYNTGYQQAFPTGTIFSASWNNTRASSGSAANFFNPFVQSSLSFNFQQQLLNGAGRFINRRNIMIAENNRKISDLAFAQQAITTVTATVTAYWELVYARQNVQVAQQAVTVSEKLFNDNKKQLEIGTMAPLDVTRAESELATDRQNLIVAQTIRIQDELVLKNDISKDPLASNLLNVEIIPTDNPDTPTTIEAASFEDAVKEAFAKRPDLQEQYFNLKNAEIDVRATKNALLPTASLNAGYSSSGLAGNSLTLGPTVYNGPSTVPIFDANGNPVTIAGPNNTQVPIFVGTGTSSVVSKNSGGFGNAQGQIFHNNFPDYSVSLNLSIPLRNRLAQADNLHAQLVQRQLEAQVQQIKNNALLDVRSTTVTLEQDRARVDAARKARELQKQTFEAEQKKYQLGASTVYQVILTQRDYITAQGTELRALADLAEARAQYERALGRTLEVNSVTIAGAKSGNIENDTLIPGTINGQVVGTQELFRALDQKNSNGKK